MTIVARSLTQVQDGIPGYMACPAGTGRPVEWHVFSEGFEPHCADLAWPLVTDFLERVV